MPFEPAQYDFRLTVGHSSGAIFKTFHWSLGADVPVFINRPDVAGRPSLGPALDQSAQSWTEAAVFGEYRLRATKNLDEAVAVLQWRDAETILSTPLGCTGPGGGAASTTGCLNESADSLVTWPRRDQGTSRVVFNVVVQWQSQMDADLLRLLVRHEMGHVLGVLAHSTDADDLMFGGFLTAEALTSRDRQTIRTLYQSPVDLHHRDR